ncbi:MAG TPA: hypothetical protein VNM35_06760 [Chitinophagaceae bacterium]|jgi:hypothetical protein|nr:hypothetical protein [Chitinophagaceae bacterium]
MKHVIWFIGLSLIGMILYKMYVFNQLSANYKSGYSYFWYNLSSSQSKADAIIRYWTSDEKRESYVRRLIMYDFAFIFIYVILLCNILYICLQQQNRLWLNKFLRTGIISIIIAGTLNLVQDYFNFLSIDRGYSYHFILIVTYAKWIFVLIAIVPLIMTLFLKPLRTIQKHIKPAV